MKRDYLRVLLTSDIHCTDLDEWYGLTNDERMELWLETVRNEHEKDPFDLILLLGDISLDFHCDITPYEKGYSSSDYFMKRYFSRLPEGVPTRIIAGNHEFGYTNREWLAITGQERMSYALLGRHLFVLLDSFGELTERRTDYLRELLARYPDCDVWLASHYFDPSDNEDRLFTLIAAEKRIRGLFMGHTHLPHAIDLGEAFSHRTIAQLGNFSFTRGDIPTTFWGFRDLIIKENSAVSRYLQRKSHATVRGEKRIIPEQISDVITYSLT